jgi:16S rRNA G527 N7-methylase RsmG
MSVDQILGPTGALVALIIGISALALVVRVLWKMIQETIKRERDRVDRLDEITARAITSLERVLEHTGTALENHKQIFANQRELLDLLREVRAEQRAAKEREGWSRRS